MSMFDNEEREQRVAKEEEKGFPRKKKVRRRSGPLCLPPSFNCKKGQVLTTLYKIQSTLLEDYYSCNLLNATRDCLTIKEIYSQRREREEGSLRIG